MPGQRGRCGAYRGHVQDSSALHKVVDSRWSRPVPLPRPCLWPRFCGPEDFVSFIHSKVGAFPYHVGVARFLGERDKGVHGAGRHCVQGGRQRFELWLKDPRVLFRCDEIWKVAPEVPVRVASLEDSATRSLSEVAEVEADEFKSSVIAASYGAGVLRAEHPWSLACGSFRGQLA